MKEKREDGDVTKDLLRVTFVNVYVHVVVVAVAAVTVVVVVDTVVEVLAVHTSSLSNDNA